MGLFGPSIPREQKEYNKALKTALKKPSEESFSKLIQAEGKVSGAWQGYFFMSHLYAIGSGVAYDEEKAAKFRQLAINTAKGGPGEAYLGRFYWWYDQPSENFNNKDTWQGPAKNLRKMIVGAVANMGCFDNLYPGFKEIEIWTTLNLLSYPKKDGIHEATYKSAESAWTRYTYWWNFPSKAGDYENWNNAFKYYQSERKSWSDKRDSEQSLDTVTDLFPYVFGWAQYRNEPFCAGTFNNMGTIACAGYLFAHAANYMGCHASLVFLSVFIDGSGSEVEKSILAGCAKCWNVTTIGEVYKTMALMIKAVDNAGLASDYLKTRYDFYQQNS